MTTDVVGLSGATCGSPRSAARRPHARHPMRQVSWHTAANPHGLVLARLSSPTRALLSRYRRERRFVGRCGRHDEGMRGSGCCSGWASSLSGCTAVSTWRNTSHSVLVHSAHEAEAAAPQSSETRDGAQSWSAWGCRIPLCETQRGVALRVSAFVNSALWNPLGRCLSCRPSPPPRVSCRMSDASERDDCGRDNRRRPACRMRCSSMSVSRGD
jgi:hypothetical protein